MDDGASGGEGVVTYAYEYKDRVHRFEYQPGDAKVYSDPVKAPPPVRFEHDAKVGVFRLVAVDGSVEVFRANPTRYLCVQPDAETGEIRPVLVEGKPVYLWLCREEREGR